MQFKSIILTFLSIWHKKAVVFDMIPAQPLSNTANKSLFEKVFPHGAKTFRSIITFTKFLKISENLTKKLIDTTIEILLLPRNTQYVLLYLIEE